MGRTTLAERVARLEEKSTHSQKSFEKRVDKCTSLFENIDRRLEIINNEQGETARQLSRLQTEIEGLKSLIEQRVSAPMSGKDKATIYVALIMSAGGIITSLVSIFA